MADVTEIPASVGNALCKHILKIGGITRGDLARALGISRQSVSDLVNDRRPVSAEQALRLARVLGTTPEYWMDLQRDVDLRIAREQMTTVIAALPVLLASASDESTRSSPSDQSVPKRSVRQRLASCFRYLSEWNR